MKIAKTNSKFILFVVCCFGIFIQVIGCENNQDLPQKSEINTQEINFISSDSLEIYGDFSAIKASKGTLLLFHQGGSNARGEYAGILGQIQNLGLSILAIDQRSGGQTYGSFNRTIYNMKSYISYPMCEAYNDLEATLNYALDNNLPRPFIIWGSSYSAALAVQLAAKNQNSIDGILAFSPASGGPMANCKIDPYLKDLEVPLIVLRPLNESKIPSVIEQLNMVRAAGHEVYIAENGNHGSSMLDPNRVEGSVVENWTTVERFVNNIIEK